MKKVIFVFLFVLLSSSLVFPSLNTLSANELKAQQETKSSSISDPEIIRTEYVSIDNMEYKIVYYSDGKIGVVATERYPED